MWERWTYKHTNAFSSIPEKGNPDSVVLNSNDYTEKQMLAIAAAVEFNETVLLFLQMNLIFAFGTSRPDMK